MGMQVNFETVVIQAIIPFMAFLLLVAIFGVGFPRNPQQ